MSKLSFAVLKLQDDVCSAAVIRLLRECSAFQLLSKHEGQAIVQRDKEDEDKLAAGIDIAIAKGILQGKLDIAKATTINVVGRTAEEVTQDILGRLPSKEGNVIVLQGLSGTGKGTTVCKLQSELPRCVTWSNGNVFRCYTHLCNEVLSAQGKTISEVTLTPQLLTDVEKRITFERCDDDDDNGFHTIIDGKTRVADIQNTLLKTKIIGAMVPTVAQQTQGEVIRFGAEAVKKLSAAGFNVILEGRAQTLNYIPTKERFELVIPDVAVLGQRRAAQRVMAKALEIVLASGNTSDEDVEKAAKDAVSQLQ